MNSLLVELLTEELPPKALKKLGEAFASGIAQGLAARKLTGADAVVTSYATPRRLAVHVTQVAAESPAEQDETPLMPTSVAFSNDGNPTLALEKKIQKKTGFPSLAAVPPSELSRRLIDGKEYLVHSVLAAGLPISRVLQQTMDETLKRLPIPKVMFYERDDGTAVNFVRPVHGLIALYGDDIVGCHAFGLESGRTTQGHRFHSSGAVTIANADSYVETLKKAHVVASYTERRASIEKQLNNLAKGDEIIAPDALLDEVTSLVEWPVVYECHFEKEFLEVPQECLILTMQTNQKYFATQKNGKLTNRFLIVSNIETKDPSLIISGNERVVRPRLADAKFFFDQDRKQTLESRLPKLANVVYHGKLGSQADRNARVTAIAIEIASLLGADVKKAERAAKLSKADLLTDMVGEFPELQGIMGTYYAKHDGEDAEVAQAITEHYQPKFAGDALPSTQTGTALALADKLETLAGMFAIGQLPTGDKDPFALRRHALGIVRMLIEKKLPLNLRTLAQHAYASFKGTPEAFEALMTFMFDRVAGYLRDLGYSAREAESVLEARPAWSEIPKHLEAVRVFLQLPEAEALAAANKRIGNILKKSDIAVGEVDESKLVEDAEKHLHVALKNAGAIAEKLFENGEYTASLRELASLRGPVDAFFDKVMVNADDPALKANRLALLQSLHTAMNRVADLSKLAT
ncbi:MAG: glycine--tRNA ligase, beta subunit [Pseudomonadota bacterium]|jgi:glycyl-tRNA synthetase beta chain